MRVALIAVLAAAALVGSAAAAAPAQASGGALYGLLSPVALVGVDTGTGGMTPIGDVVPNEDTADSLSSYDDAKGLYYMVGYNNTAAQPNLLAIDTATGKVVSDVVLPFTEPEFVGVGQTVDVDQASGDVYVSGQYNLTGLHHVLRVDPATGKHKDIAQLGQLSMLGGGSTFDSAHGVLYLQYGVKATNGVDIYAVDVATGHITTITQDPSTGEVLTSMVWDKKSGHIFGTGVMKASAPRGARYTPGDERADPAAFVRLFNKLDVVTGAISVVAKLSDYLMQYSEVVAIDEASRRVFAVMQKVGANNTDPFHLVAVQTDTGAVAAAPSFCSITANTCPWNMEFAN